jgi:hypothetical protein
VNGRRKERRLKGVEESETANEKNASIKEANEKKEVRLMEWQKEYGTAE